MAPTAGASNLETDFADFFEHALLGLLTASAGGRIQRANIRFAQWIGYSAEELVGGRFSDYLTIAGKIYFETHLQPLLRMQGFFDEIALDLACRNGDRFPVIVNAVERRDDDGRPLFVRLTVVKAEERRRYESELLEARAAAQAANSELRKLNAELAQRVADEVKDRLDAEGHLVDERATAALREQFVAVLGHDLRNPLASISGGARMLAKQPLNEKAAMLVAMIDSSVMRMAGLIDNVMDFARGRLGDGLNLNRMPGELAPILEHVVDELRTAHPQRVILADFELPFPIDCDSVRVSQLLSNLIANALTHGAASGPVRTRARIDGASFELTVANDGSRIPEPAIKRLFQPFTRDEVRPNRQGLGLGLYIVSEIARAHGGVVSVTSTDRQTVFTFRMPLASAAPRS